MKNKVIGVILIILGVVSTIRAVIDKSFLTENFGYNSGTIVTLVGFFAFGYYYYFKKK
jgi:uncharacterized membrane protein HdeD (DUF308 family)